MSVLVKPPTIQRRSVTWPTVFEFIFVQLGFLSAITLSISFPHLSRNPLYIALFVIWGMMLTIMTFTVSHEASHRNVCRSKFWNDWAGRISIFWMHGGFQHFRDAHLAHHANANVPGDDPDYHASRSPSGIFVLIWWAFSLVQYIGYLHKRKRFITGLGAMMTYIVIVAIYLLAWRFGFAWELFMAWSFPVLFGTTIVVYIFDHLPHVPHKETERYRLARIMEVSPLLSFAMQGHNYHLIHHLWPSIPWYEYGLTYREKKQELLDAGITVT